MGQAIENVINRSQIVHIAYRDNIDTIAQIIPYLRERHMAAKKYLTVPYEDQEKAYEALFQHIQSCNKSIAEILGITPDQISKP
jgi:hypothetical protein